MEANCFVWDIDPVLLPIHGPIMIRWYGICFMLVFLVGWWLLRWQFGRAGRDVKHAADFIYWAMGGVVLGAWFGHRFFYEFDRILSEPLYLIDVSGGLTGLSSHGATIGLCVVLVLFARKHSMRIGEMFDRFSFCAAAGATLVRVGNFFNSEILGRPSDVPWAVCFPRVDKVLVPRHPSQLYEVAIGLAVMGALLLVDRLAGRERRPVWLLGGTFFVSYFLLRFFVEFYKAHQALPASSALTMGQYLSIPFFLLGVGLVIWSLKYGQRTDEATADSLKRAQDRKDKKGKKGKK
ncbi:MAG: prolipoprotein diacylglyceryl transferase [Deltaproteobacteria bacterium]|nr:prolipoprotein diacylglyceryl transferase [Deltaproteobacteria bacterium]